MERNAFCSATCAEAAAEEAPMLLEVPKDDPSFKLGKISFYVVAFCSTMTASSGQTVRKRMEAYTNTT